MPNPKNLKVSFTLQNQISVKAEEGLSEKRLSDFITFD